MTHRNPSRGRRTPRRSAERRALKDARRDYFDAQHPKRLQVPDHIQALADEPREESDA